MGIRRHFIPEYQRVSQNPSGVGVDVIPIVISSVGLLWTSNFIDCDIFKTQQMTSLCSSVFIYQSDSCFLDGPLIPAVALLHHQPCLPFAVANPQNLRLLWFPLQATGLCFLSLFSLRTFVLLEVTTSKGFNKDVPCNG